MTFLINFLHESKNKKRFVYKSNGILKETEAIWHRTGTGPAPGPEKNTFTFGNTMKFNDWLSSSAKITYTKSKSNRIQQGSNTAGVYLGLLRNPTDFDISDYKGTYYDSNGNNPLNPGLEEFGWSVEVKCECHYVPSDRVNIILSRM